MQLLTLGRALGRAHFSMPLVERSNILRERLIEMTVPREAPCGADALRFWVSVQATPDGQMERGRLLSVTGMTAIASGKRWARLPATVSEDASVGRAESS